MISHLDEFKDYYKHTLASLLSVFIDTEKQVYEDFEGVQNFLKSKASDSFANRKAILKRYLEFLRDNDYVPESELIDMYAFLNKAKRADYLDLQYFTSVDELYQTCCKDIITANNNCNAKVADYSDLKVFFFLQWYGVDMKDYFSIKLSDVNEDERTIFVPSLNRMIYPDERIFACVLSYKNQDIKSNDLNTLYRPLHASQNFNASLRNRRNKFYKVVRDKRYYEKNILIAGIMFEIREHEINLNRKIYMKDLDEIVRLEGKSYNVKYNYLSIYQSIYGK